jgi:hypothetical protein
MRDTTLVLRATTRHVWSIMSSALRGWMRGRRRRPRVSRLSPEWLRQHEVDAGKHRELR